MTFGNIEITPGSGAPVAVDTIIGDGFQRVKLVDGTEGGGDEIPGDATNGLLVKNSAKFASAATLTNQTDQATNVTLCASNAARKGLIVYNDSPSTMYLKYGATASATSFTVKIPADGYWEMPDPVYTGQIDVIWSSDSTGSARATEL